MRTVSKEQLDNIITEHKKWLAGEGGESANLLCANLLCANLLCANLLCANLRGANLRSAKIAEGFVLDGKNHQLTNVGSENGILELYSCGGKGWYVKRGCFSGSKEEFINAVKETHGDNGHSKKYLAMIEIFCV